jgi:Domain of Unknown Function (DUF1080)
VRAGVGGRGEWTWRVNCRIIARMPRRLIYAASALLILLLVATTQCDLASLNPATTEQWQPKPPRVPARGSPATPPGDAIVLFDGRGLGEWAEAGSAAPARWTAQGGVLTVVKAAGNIETRRRFGNYRLHLEWRIPADISGSGQERGNSGLFLASTGPGDAGYELQILDSWDNETYVNGQAGAIYKQHPPLANPARPPGEWQSYDVVWTAPRFGEGGKLLAPARLTAYFNGVVIQDNAELMGETVYIGRPSYKAHGLAPIKLQAHGDPSEPISFRNIWVQELP